VVVIHERAVSEGEVSHTEGRRTQLRRDNVGKGRRKTYKSLWEKAQQRTASMKIKAPKQPRRKDRV